MGAHGRRGVRKARRPPPRLAVTLPALAEALELFGRETARGFDLDARCVAGADLGDGDLEDTVEV